MLSVEAAQSDILAHVSAQPSETVALRAALGRALAVDVAAPADEPPVALSAMDGYAVRTADLASGAAILPIAFEVAAGIGAARALPSGACARIFTGGVLPTGADAIVMQEEVTRDGDRAAFSRRVEIGHHVRAPGTELARGEVILRRGEVFTPGALALTTSFGMMTVHVARRPRLAVFSTGSELVDPPALRPLGAVYDGNRPALAALVGSIGGEASELVAVRDDLAATVARLREVESYDFVLSSGGVSVGDHDHVRAALDEAGWTTILWRVAMKPGKPILVARRGTTLYFGLPGNPVSAHVGFHLFVRPALRAALGLSPHGDVPRVRALVDRPLGADGRRHYVRAQVALDGAGAFYANVASRQGSSAMASLATCNALVVVEPGERYAPGDAAPTLLIGPLRSEA